MSVTVSHGVIRPLATPRTDDEELGGPALESLIQRTNVREVLRTNVLLPASAGAR